jgi:hypothetical protein
MARSWITRVAETGRPVAFGDRYGYDTFTQSLRRVGPRPALWAGLCVPRHPPEKEERAIELVIDQAERPADTEAA